MKKLYCFFTLLICMCLKARADHITGGEIFYTYSSAANGMYNYNITFKLFMRCGTDRQFNNPTVVSIFDKGTNQRISNINVPLSSSQTISLSNTDPCISDPPEVCYEVGYYVFSVLLPASANGYVLSSQVNFRIAGINNMITGYNNVGALYSAEIPGTGQVTTGPQNNSAKFVGSDLVIVCANNRFSYSFAATDPDGDELRYSFCEAYRSSGAGNRVAPTDPPPYYSIPYGNGYNGNAPLGGDVHVNSSTGLITGVAPSAGIYVVTVCVEEIRNGKVIAMQRKDLQIKIAPCNIAAAMLPPDYMLCGSTKTIYLENLSTSPLIRTYYWQLTNRAGIPLFSTTEPTVNYTFEDTGTYFIKLVVNRGEKCTDSTTSLVRVYPGFVPAFNYAGICFKKPTGFTDGTSTVYGSVNSWSWNFGDGSVPSKERNPIYTFPGMGAFTVQLIVTNTVGCRDTIARSVGILDKPPIKLNFKDTLICIGDPVTLSAQGSGTFSWSPTTAINANVASPTVTPSATTTYTVNLNDNGCLNSDSVVVRVTDHVNLQIMNDTTICSGDTIQLRVISDAFKYSWSPAGQIVNAGAASPLAVTANTTTYQVVANIGSCSATNKVTVTTVPYPFVNAGKDTTICFNTWAQLSGTTDGKTFTWAPSVSLDNATILNPVASPNSSTTYILSAYDTKGCPKRGADSAIVTVLPPIAAFAGRDTSVIIEQPLQLKASGGIGYLWSPSIGLSATNIANPIALYNEPDNGIRYTVLVSNEAGCVDSASITVKVFSTGPSIFVPTAFTPNADGRNDMLRPIAAGMKQIEFFNVYNRWGQLVFSTNINGKGWDGTINGKPQPTGVFVWMVKAVDYTGTPYFKKGTVTLIK